jgi:hypothetical protein
MHSSVAKHLWFVTLSNKIKKKPLAEIGDFINENNSSLSSDIKSATLPC